MALRTVALLLCPVAAAILAWVMVYRTTSVASRLIGGAVGWIVGAFGASVLLLPPVMLVTSLAGSNSWRPFDLGELLEPVAFFGVLISFYGLPLPVLAVLIRSWSFRVQPQAFAKAISADEVAGAPAAHEGTPSAPSTTRVPWE